MESFPANLILYSRGGEKRFLFMGASGTNTKRAGKGDCPNQISNIGSPNLRGTRFAMPTTWKSFTIQVGGR